MKSQATVEMIFILGWQDPYVLSEEEPVDDWLISL